MYQLSASSGVVQENLPGGQILYFSGSGITSSTGDAVRFIRDAAGRITTIEAPNGAQEIYDIRRPGQSRRMHNTVSGQSSNYGYAAGDPHLLTLATAPAAGSGAAVIYGPTVQVVPLTASLGGTESVPGREFRRLPDGGRNRLVRLLADRLGSRLDQQRYRPGRNRRRGCFRQCSAAGGTGHCRIDSPGPALRLGQRLRPVCDQPRRVRAAPVRGRKRQHGGCLHPASIHCR